MSTHGLLDGCDVARIESALNDAHLGGRERHTEAGRHAVENEVFRRFEQAARFDVPRVDRVAPGHRHWLPGVPPRPGARRPRPARRRRRLREWSPITLEERLLQTFFLERERGGPAGLSRCVLDLVFRKPDGPMPCGPLIPPGSRASLLTNDAARDREGGRRRDEELERLRLTVDRLEAEVARRDGRISELCGVADAQGRRPFELTAHPASAAPGPIRRGARRLGRLPGRTTRAMLRGWP